MMKKWLPVVFQKPEGEKHRHLKLLHLEGFINGRTITKMLVKGGVAINFMDYTTCRKLGKTPKDLINTGNDA